MEQSRAAAEGYRHEAEQALIVRTAELDQLAARRDADLVEREEQIAGERAAMRAEANAKVLLASVGSDGSADGEPPAGEPIG